MGCWLASAISIPPESVVAEFVQLLRLYRVRQVYGDRYAGVWPREQFWKHGVTYRPAEEPKSDLYRDILPLLNSQRVELLDHNVLVAQLCSLERGTSRGGRDDVANAVAGALLTASQAESRKARRSRSAGWIARDLLNPIHFEDVVRYGEM
jgi:hypothetical protein